MTPRNSGRDRITIETDQTVQRRSRKGESPSICTVKVSNQPPCTAPPLHRWCSPHLEEKLYFNNCSHQRFWCFRHDPAAAIWTKIPLCTGKLSVQQQIAVMQVFMSLVQFPLLKCLSVNVSVQMLLQLFSFQYFSIKPFSSCFVTLMNSKTIQEETKSKDDT